MGASLVAAVAVALATGGPAPAGTGILAIGDFGVGGKTERRMGAAVRDYEARRPAAVLATLGDNDYTESPTAFLRNWRDAFGWLEAAGVAPAGSLGNHDVRVDGGRYEFEALGMPRARYVRSLGDIDLFVLNSNRVNDKQTAWLRRRLAGSTARWKIAVFHHPAYTCGGYRGHPGVQSRWVPLFERYGVDLVLAGHDHNYQRFRRWHGVRYVVHGGGGAELYALEACPRGYPRRQFGRAARGFLHLKVRDDAIIVRAITPRGTVLDRFTIYP
jgi:hypothetical protein